jgi:hypothetical protein
MVRGTFSKYPDRQALKLLSDSASENAAPHESAPLVQIEQPEKTVEETRA